MWRSSLSRTSLFWPTIFQVQRLAEFDSAWWNQYGESGMRLSLGIKLVQQLLDAEDASSAPVEFDIRQVNLDNSPFKVHTLSIDRLQNHLTVSSKHFFGSFSCCCPL